jgi:aminoglycoside 3-N-acetyltransferase
MTIITYRDILRALRELGLNQDSHVIAHVSLAALEPGGVRGGTETVIGALLASCGTVVMPAFTPQTLVWPASGPADNGCTYGDHTEENSRAVMFTPDLPVDADLGQAAELFRRHPQARRSDHPVLSFAAVGAHAQDIVAAQSLDSPLGPIEWLYDHGGAVLLMGADHRRNTAIHLAEKFAGRKQFVRWAVGPERAYRLPDFPGCSNGFNAIAAKLAWVTHQAAVGPLALQHIPITNLIEVAVQTIQEDPYALLCSDLTCKMCNAVRQATV